MVIYLVVIIEFRQEEMLKLKMLQATPQFSTQPTGVVELDADESSFAGFAPIFFRKSISQILFRKNFPPIFFRKSLDRNQLLAFLRSSPKVKQHFINILSTFANNQ